jgi:hypothetical protein
MQLFEVLRVWLHIVAVASVALVLIRYIRCTLILMAVMGSLTFINWFEFAPPLPPPPAMPFAAPAASPDVDAVLDGEPDDKPTNP